MDIWLHILLIVIIGVFFFLDKYSKSFNPMMFVIIFSLLGFFLIVDNGVQIIDYYSINVTDTTVIHQMTNANDIGIGPISLQNFFVLVYLFMFFISAVNLVLGKIDSEKDRN
jgi:hypothetical protein